MMLCNVKLLIEYIIIILYLIRPTVPPYLDFGREKEPIKRSKRRELESCNLNN